MSGAKSGSISRSDPMDEDDDLLGEEKELGKNKDTHKNNTGQQQSPLFSKNVGSQSLNQNQINEAISNRMDIDLVYLLF